MLHPKDKNLSNDFLKYLSKIKGWEYHSGIEKEKKNEIKEFINFYVLREKYGEAFLGRVSYNRLQFFVRNPNFTPSIKALVALLEFSSTEEEFAERFQKANYINSVIV